MKTSVSVLLIPLLGLVTALWAQQPGTNRPGPGFPVLPRIADADPSVIHEVDARIPTALSVTRTPDQLSYQFDRASSQTVKIMVGKNMVTGVRAEFRVYPQGTAPPQQPAIWLGEGLGGFNSGAFFMNRTRDGIPLPGVTYTIEADIAIFETDIPTQHTWSPTGSPNYKVLWRTTLKQLVD
jgi:hypothetical protein